MKPSYKHFDSFNKDKLLVFMIALLLFISLVLTLAYLRFSYAFGGDIGLGYSTFSGIFKGFFIWSTSNYSGLINSTGNGSIFGDLFSLIIIFFTKIFFLGTKTNIISNVILELLAILGIFFLIYKLTSRINNKAAIISGFLAASFFGLWFSYFSVNIGSIAALPFSVLFLYLFADYGIKNKKVEYRYFILSVIFLSFEFALLGYGGIVEGFILILIIVLYLFFASIRKSLKTATILILILFIAVMMNFSLIFNTYIAQKNTGGELSLLQGNSQQDFQQSYYSVPISVLALFGGSNLNTAHDMIPSLILLIIAIVPLIALNQKEKSLRYFSTALILSLLIFFGLSSSINKPFGNIFSYLYKNFSFLVTFRYGGASTLEIFFIISVLLGLGVFTILNYLYSDIKKKKLVNIFLVFIAAFIFYHVYIYGIEPIFLNGVPWTTHLLPFINTLPKHVVEISEFINLNVTGFSVATLPSDDDWHLATWYDAPDIYSSLINAPVYTGGFVTGHEFFFPSSQDEYGSVVRLYEENITNYSIADSLGIFGIKYIIVQGNTADKTFGPNHPLIPYSFNTIYFNLNNSKRIVFVGKFGNSTVYKNEIAVPLVYGSNIIKLGSNTSLNIIKFIEKRHINSFIYSIYSPNVSAPILWYGNIQLFDSSNTINATQIANFSKPNISFVENTPTKVTVHVSNATTPYYLVFRETYDPHWAAFYSNGTEVNPRDHIAVNGFANAWYMNKTGNYTVTLYYTLQTDAWIAWGVSFAALFVTIGIGIYGWQETRKEKGGRSIMGKRLNS